MKNSNPTEKNKVDLLISLGEILAVHNESPLAEKLFKSALSLLQKYKSQYYDKEYFRMN